MSSFHLDSTTVEGMGFPGGSVVRESACQCRRHRRCRCYPWVGKIPSRRTWQPTPLFLPGKYHGEWSLVGTIHRAAKRPTNSTHTYWEGKVTCFSESHFPLIITIRVIGKARPYYRCSENNNGK